MNITPTIVERLRAAIRTERLVDTAVRLIEIPSPTRSGTAVAERLAEMLSGEGFETHRPVANWAPAPAVAARFQTAETGRTLQFNGHLDTVHLPFVPPRVEGGVLFGSGASDMKGGIAAMFEALRVLRETGCLTRGGILLTAHDLHEMPWGDGTQVDALIDEGYLGDGVLLPEYLSQNLPVVGRGLAVLEARVTRQGTPLHEVLGGLEQPNVIAAGAELVRRLLELDRQVAVKTDPLAGRESVFIGQVAAGEIYNQSPVEFRLSGTRRWLTGSDVADVERQFQQVAAEVAAGSGVAIESRFIFCRDAFALDQTHPLVAAFQAAHAAATGRELPIGAKPFVDDGNTFSARGHVPAITHGPDAKGAHTLHEAVPVAELTRVALVYALTAIAFCGADHD